MERFKPLPSGPNGDEAPRPERLERSQPKTSMAYPVLFVVEWLAKLDLIGRHGAIATLFGLPSAIAVLFAPVPTTRERSGINALLYALSHQRQPSRRSPRPRVTVRPVRPE